ncbi:tyrosine-type recombinase/integrase [Natronomonas sp. CBA1123]|uniref:tyrosine-type recombinase/integrase n=1 Tax=Natronomonas sp. CBA1123 TaxID=2668070 RepID=UPI0012EA2F15|nr:tyrosine-type recombinase/integrase [Natronomonas sp. CBA1123]MUV86996.1 tyrosine-type recombinase/integrase [Natronomonas sp. CBA1123]
MSVSDTAGDGPPRRSIRQAIDRFIKRRKTEMTDRTIRSDASRLADFADWCADRDVTMMDELSPWLLDEYDLELRDRDLAAITIKSKLTTIRVFLKYCARTDLVEDDLPDSIDVPTLEAAEESSDERLEAEDAQASLSFFRDSKAYFGVPMHAFLELAWHTGARIGSIRGLDLGDYDADEQFVHFRHRPSEGTPLKNKHEGERLVGLTDAVCAALDTYIARERSDKRDEKGRAPLFCGRQGRPSFSTFRYWSYQATQPCLWTECPHGRRRATCEYTERNHASKCPSSRSPHRIRTGSITWQLNRGLDIETVATRVNANADTIRRYYDAATQTEEFEERRRDVEARLDISNSEDKL